MAETTRHEDYELIAMAHEMINNGKGFMLTALNKDGDLDVVTYNNELEFEEDKMMVAGTLMLSETIMDAMIEFEQDQQENDNDDDTN